MAPAHVHVVFDRASSIYLSKSTKFTKNDKYLASIYTLVGEAQYMGMQNKRKEVDVNKINRNFFFCKKKKKKKIY